MVEIIGLEKSFKKLKVLNGVDAHIEKGKVTAIIGPNGSGKTTTIKCILGLVIPDKGDILINKQSIRGDCNYRRQIGYMPQIAKFPDNLTLKELIAMIIDIRGNCDLNIRKDVIHHLGLEAYMTKALKTLSGGTKQKVNALIAFMFNPEILILDEPTVGLDPLSNRYLKERLIKEKENGKAIILTSHIMSEVEEIGDKVIFLLEGKKYVEGSIKELILETHTKNLESAIAKIMEETRHAQNPKV